MESLNHMSNGENNDVNNEVLDEEVPQSDSTQVARTRDCWYS